MRISLNWLKQLVEIPQDLSDDEISDRLTFAGFEVEEVIALDEDIQGVIVGHIVSKEQHPNADKLSLCKVNAGGDEPVQVVCGAQNFVQGDFAAFAPVGVVVGEDFKIKKNKIRGEESFGMLCSEKELGLSDENVGIMVLQGEDLAPGMTLAKALHYDDVVLVVGVTPNRPDALSHIGLAREIAAILGGRARFQTSPSCAERGGPVESFAHVTIEDPEGCPRYACRVINDVKIGPSPIWLKARLAACGVRSVSNVVDVTNLVMMERGLPLHAFDLDCVGKDRDRTEVIVRRAKEGETLKTLDGEDRKLEPSDVVIADPKGPIALAGVMGGATTEVSEHTTQVLLEAAYFDPSAVRKTARKFDLHSEASHRFERGCDPNGVRASLDRAASLIAEVAKGEVCRGVCDVYPRRIEEKIVLLRPSKAASLLGIPPAELGEALISEHLMSLGLEVNGREADAIRLRIPTWRPDLTREVDLIEEILRLVGYEKVKPTLPARRGEAKALFNHHQHHVSERVRNVLSGKGFLEAVNLAFVSEQEQRLLNDDENSWVSIANPLGEKTRLLRTSLLPRLLRNVKENLRHGVSDVRLYEMGQVFLGKNERGQVARKDDDDGPPGGDSFAIEAPRLAGVLCGNVELHHHDEKPRSANFYDLKGVLEEILQSIGVNIGMHLANVVLQDAENAGHLHPRARAEIFVQGANAKMPPQLIGTLGEVHPDLLALVELKTQLFAFELDVAALSQVAQLQVKVVDLPKFPSVKRDLAFVIDENLPVGELCRSLSENVKVASLLENVDVFDVYHGEQLGEGKKSVALSFVFRSQKRTLTDKDITKATAALVADAERLFSAQVRE
ncbi:MAG: phenylalanine--tRNA ligase subunit beta [Deltaproteobacteria bacterium]|nr:phenylalanine--tRNA ligase subunit beta [Deltaproteobacteria bacterium]